MMEIRLIKSRVCDGCDTVKHTRAYGVVNPKFELFEHVEDLCDECAEAYRGC